MGSVWWALKQPGPGEGRRQRAEGYEVKRRAFNIIFMTILVALINYLTYVVLIYLPGDNNINLDTPADNVAAIVLMFCGLLSPIFYLLRAKKLPSLTDLKIIK